jgi:hypothetical protein
MMEGKYFKDSKSIIIESVNQNRLTDIINANMKRQDLAIEKIDFFSREDLYCAGVIYRGTFRY